MVQDTDPQLLVALGIVIVVLCGVIVVFARQLSATKIAAEIAADQSSQTNKATNGVGPGEHRLYDMVVHIKEAIEPLIAAQADFTERGWRHLPGDIDDATGLTLTIRGLQTANERNFEDHDLIRAEVGEVKSLLRDVADSL